MRALKTSLAAGAIAIAIAFAAPTMAFATENNNGNNGNHHGNQTEQAGVEVNIDAELDIENNSSAVATGGAGGAGGNATSTSTATGGAGGNANAWGGTSSATGGSAEATGGNATGGNATGGNATGGNATGGSADNTSVNTANNTLTSTTTNTNANSNSADNSSSATGGNASADNNGNNNGNNGNNNGNGNGNNNGNDNGNNNGNNGNNNGNNGNNGNNNSSSANSQGQSQSVDNNSSNSNNSDQNVEVNTYNERAPVSTAYAAPLAVGEDTCMGSSTLGAQAVSFGLSIGTTWQDANCRRLKNSRQLVALGYHRAAASLMCIDEDVRAAMEEAGTPCPSRNDRPAQMTPAAVSVPAPSPVCPTNDFVVPFDWDRSNLNRTAARIIDEAVARARQCNVNAVLVIGHTDTSGSNAYNAALSQRRAVVVRNAMIDRGVSADLIETDARGEADLARATGDGIREVTNRRTAVTISFR